MGYKIRESQTKKIPLTLIIGDQEKDNNTISYRVFGKTDTITLPMNEFIDKMNSIINSKAIEI